MNKSEIQQHASSIFQSNVHGVPLGSDEQAFALALLEFHPDKIEKVGLGITSIVVNPNPDAFNTSCFWLVRSDGTEIDFSSSKCLKHMTVQEGRSFTW